MVVEVNNKEITRLCKYCEAVLVSIKWQNFFIVFFPGQSSESIYVEVLEPTEHGPVKKQEFDASVRDELRMLFK